MSTNNRMFFLLLINNVRVLVIFKRIIVTICKKDKQLEYIFLEIYHTQNGLYKEITVPIIRIVWDHLESLKSKKSLLLPSIASFSFFSLIKITKFTDYDI